MADEEKAVLNVVFESEDMKINFWYICKGRKKTMTAVINEFIRETVEKEGIALPKINYNKRG